MIIRIINKMKLTIIYDNEARPGLKAGWGFSCLIEEDNKKILLDTGDNGPALLYNLKKLGYNSKDVDIVVLSHQHWDHTGGLFDLLNQNSEIEVFVLESFSSHFRNEIKKRAKLVEVERERKIIGNIYTTGLIENNPDEQSLILKTGKGIIVVAGCSHPGVDKILEIAKKYGRIYSVIGGFHGFSDFDVLKDIKIIGACHCTHHKDKIRERFPKQFREIKAGDVIE